MGYYTRGGSIFGKGKLLSRDSAIYDLNAIFLNPYVDFAAITFSNCGATGPIGPTLAQCQATYDANVESNLSVNFGYQSYTIPYSGTYRFTVKGASGGVWQTSPMSTTTAASSPTIDGYTRLPGATVQGDYYLNANDVITMVIGQGGGDDNDADANCPGAGGGTFVTLGTFSNIQAATDSLLFVAGGGAGCGYNSADSPTLAGTSGRGQSGTSGGTSGSENGGSGGNGSPSTQTSGNSVGGGGYLNGPGNTTTNNFTYTLSSANRVAAGFRQGATGGTWTGSSRGYGGFGCGGQGASTTGSDDDKGGGGGYSGGGLAFDAGEAGGGGGSFIHVAATNTTATAGGNTTGRHGSVLLELV